MIPPNNDQIHAQDRMIREAERLRITSISRSQAYQLEKLGRFPKRVRLGNRSVGWRLSELMFWVSAGGQISEQPEFEGDMNEN
ncbi:AlpA family transcriptional regulator [Shewanella sp. NR704-98]|uniref:AlpA family transcriptional regulator n=2 Tax=Shewanella nanhaiensis TaxID=2864872 RepID=A0ABS7EAJ1_9GAMM|nr:AlpA family transcriptional regulator [Shewanella nanhaiensis]